MAKYLIQVSLTFDGISGVKHEGGSGRRKAAEEVVKSVGGTLEAFYFCLGEYDAIALAELPDNTAAAALALAVGAGGGATLRTVALLTPEDIDAAAHREVRYRPPGA
jgi:uncharacterized protein with GYD domain